MVEGGCPACLNLVTYHECSRVLECKLDWNSAREQCIEAERKTNLDDAEGAEHGGRRWPRLHNHHTALAVVPALPGLRTTRRRHCHCHPCFIVCAQAQHFSIQYASHGMDVPALFRMRTTRCGHSHHHRCRALIRHHEAR